MRIISFANNKGGVGKTTSALAVAHRLADLNHRVLFIDADPQANASTASGLLTELPHLGLALAEGPQTPNLSTLLYQATPTLSLIRADRLMAQQEKGFGNSPDYQFFFRHQLEVLEKQFDYVIIDTAPNLGALTVSALVASEAVFIPLQPNLFGSEGMTALLQMVARLKRSFNQQLRVGGIFFTKYSPTYRKALHHQYAQDLQDDPTLASLIMKQTIRENVALDEAQSMQKSIYQWAPASNGATDYRQLTDEILTRLA
ncbi:MAG: ParA family protein [Hymenobacter sp.]|nr:MAG: ParA family protein [Hymenobacter sp.]